MVQINKREIVQRVVDGLRLEGGADKIPQESEDKLRPVFVANEIGEVRNIFSDVANENDRTLVVPKGKKWKFIVGFVTLASTATVGNRNMRIEFQDENGNIFVRLNSNSVQAASQTYRYNIIPTIPDAGVASSNVTIGIPGDIELPEGWQIKLYDHSNIDNADDMVSSIIIKEFSMEG